MRFHAKDQEGIDSLLLGNPESSEGVEILESTRPISASKEVVVRAFARDKLDALLNLLSQWCDLRILTAPKFLMGSGEFHVFFVEDNLHIFHVDSRTYSGNEPLPTERLEKKVRLSIETSDEHHFIVDFDPQIQDWDRSGRPLSDPTNPQKESIKKAQVRFRMEREETVLIGNLFPTTSVGGGLLMERFFLLTTDLKND